jgi:hypothetical protein
LARGPNERVTKRILFVVQAVDKNPSDRIIALFAQRQGARDVSLFNTLKHLFHDLGFTPAVFFNDKQHALDDDGDTKQRDQQNGPHDGASMFEELHRGHVEEECER